MAALQAIVNIPATQLLPGLSTVVGWLMAPPHQRVKVLGFALTFDLSGATIELKEAIVPSIPAGFIPMTTAHLVLPDLPELIQTSYGNAFSVQPTFNASKTLSIYPMAGYGYMAPQGDEQIVPGGKTWLISLTSPNPVAVRGYFSFEE